LLPYGGRGPSWLFLAVPLAVVVGAGALAVQSLRRGSALIRLRQDFVANVSHELKTPLARIRLLNELLLNGRRKDSDKASRYGRVIDRECRRLGFLVDNVLDFSRLERSATRPERIELDLCSLVEETIESVRVSSEDRLSLVTSLQDVPPILGDASALSQVLVNLLDNAAKYSSPGAPIEVSLCARNGWIELAVADHGRGIPEAELEPDLRRILSHRRRRDAASCRQRSWSGPRSPCGRGAWRMHQRRERCGPWEQVPGAAPGPPVGAGIMKTTRLLLIEDDQDLAVGLTDALETEGYEVESAADGLSGLAEAQRGRYALVILDAMLPDISGFAVLRELRLRSSVPVLMLTARSQEVDKVRGLRLGADDYVTKPFGVMELLARVEALLRRAHVGREQPERLELGEAIVDFRAREASCRGRQVTLTAREFEVLELLAARRGEAVSRAELVARIWGTSDELEVSTRTVDQHIASLRRKLGDDADDPS
jgi:DNA-binding response OmpR family regulator